MFTKSLIFSIQLLNPPNTFCIICIIKYDDTGRSQWWYKNDKHGIIVS